MLLAVMLMTAFSVRADAQALAALVTDARGKVEIQRPGESWSVVSVMGRVPPRSQVRVAGGGQAALSFVQGGIKVRLIGPVTVQVDNGGAKAIAGAASNVQTTRPDGRTALSVPGGVNINKMGGQLSRGAPPLAFICGPAFLSRQPVLKWLSNADRATGKLPTYEKYQVKIVDVEGNVVLKNDVSGQVTELHVPSGTLTVGKTYRMMVSGFPYNEADPPSAHQDMKVLDAATVSQVESARQQALQAWSSNSKDTTPLAVLTYVYLQNGLTMEAIETCEKIVESHPDSHDAAVLLDRLYRDMKLIDRAQALEKKTGVQPGESGE